MKSLQLLKPQIALLVFVVALFIYLIFLDKEGVFQQKFLQFGPDPDAKFLNMKLNTWNKVISVYVIAFFSAASLSYYQNFASAFVNQVLINPAYKGKIHQSEFWSKILVAVDPLITAVMGILNILVAMTLQLQFIIWQLIGNLVITIPNNLRILSSRQFTS
jgi:hypothetical protein